MNLKDFLNETKYFSIYNANILLQTEDILKKNNIFEEQKMCFIDELSTDKHLKLLYKDVVYIVLEDRILIEYGNQAHHKNHSYEYGNIEIYFIIYNIVTLIAVIVDNYEIEINISSIQINNIRINNEMDVISDYVSPYGNKIEIFYEIENNIKKSENNPEIFKAHCNAYSFDEKEY